MQPVLFKSTKNNFIQIKQKERNIWSYTNIWSKSAAYQVNTWHWIMYYSHCTKENHMNLTHIIGFSEKQHRRKHQEHCHKYLEIRSVILHVQWNLSVTTTSKIKFITCDLFSNGFNEDWRCQFTRANNFCLLELI